MSYTITRAGIERLDEIEPLWRALRDHHASVAAGVAPVRSAEESWARRRVEYADWLSSSSTTLFIAEHEMPLGYLMLRVVDGPPTWAIGEHIAEVETLSILPAARGQGVGHALMAAAREEATRKGVATLSVALVHTNEDARRFYEREGFRPFYLSLLAPLAVDEGPETDNLQ